MRMLMMTIGLWVTAASTLTAQERKVRDVTHDRAFFVAWSIGTFGLVGSGVEAVWPYLGGTVGNDLVSATARGARWFNERFAADLAAALTLTGETLVYPWLAVSLGW